MYVDYSGHMPTWLTYTLGALAFVVAGVLVAATMGMMAPGVICAASFTLSFLARNPRNARQDQGFRALPVQLKNRNGISVPVFDYEYIE